MVHVSTLAPVTPWLMGFFKTHPTLEADKDENPLNLLSLIVVGLGFPPILHM